MKRLPDTSTMPPYTGTFVVEDEGVVQGSAPILDFVGAGVTAAVGGGVATVTIPGGGGFLPSTGTVVVRDEGVIQGSAPILDFVGAGVTAAIAGGVATVTIPGGGGFLPSTGTVVLLDEGVIQGSVSQFDFIGEGVAAAAVGLRGEIVVNPLMVQDDMAPQGYATAMDFVGAGVTAVVAAGQATVTIPGGGGFLPSTGTVVVEDEGVIQGSAPILDFVGAGVTAAVAGGVATVTIPGGGTVSVPVTGSVVLLDEGLILGSVTALDVVGVGMTASRNGTTGTFTTSGYRHWEPDKPPSAPDDKDDEFNDNSVSVAWTEFDPGAKTTVSENSQHLNLLQATHALDSLAGIFRLTPDTGTGSYSIWTKVSMLAGELNYGSCGLALFLDATNDPANTDIYVLNLTYNTAGMAIQAEKWTDYDTWSSNLASDTSTVVQTYIYLRIRKSGATYSFDYSFDGLGWVQLYTSAVLAVTAKEFGLYQNNQNSGLSVLSCFQFFRCVDGASTVNDIMAGGYIS